MQGILPNSMLLPVPDRVTAFRQFCALDATISIKVGKAADFYKIPSLLWVIPIVWPPTVIVPVRLIVVFILTRNVTCPFPLNTGELETKIQLELLFTA